jgi:hypothetical protein
MEYQTALEQLEESNRLADQVISTGMLEVDEMYADIPDFSRSWKIAEQVVKDLEPVSWSLWRIMRFVMGNGSFVNKPLEGMVTGYLKFLVMVGNDPLFGNSVEIKSASVAVRVLAPDIIVATLFAHSIACRLYQKPYKKIWGTMFDDAIVRSRIGYELGKKAPEFSAGKGMIAGIASRVGLVILIATGSPQQAARTLQMLSKGATLSETGLTIYATDPSHVMGQIILRCGLGQDATIGVLSHGNINLAPSNTSQKQWRSAIRLIEATRSTTYNQLEADDWQVLHLLDPELREDFRDSAKAIIKNGHDWQFLLTPST